MKHLSKEKYQIAWFKLSEFVRRRQKERALGMYKLLMHSVEDPAFAKQVEGDLLLFFEEPEALTAYIEAAEMYKKKGNLAQATAIYEHLVILEPNNANLLKQLTKLYGTINHPTRIVLSMKRLIEPIVQAGNITFLNDAFEQLMPLIEVEEQANLYQTTVFAMLEYDHKNTSIILPLLEQAIRCFSSSTEQLKNFIIHLGTVDKDYQEKALKLSKKIKNEAEH